MTPYENHIFEIHFLLVIATVCAVGLLTVYLGRNRLKPDTRRMLYFFLGLYFFIATTDLLAGSSNPEVVLQKFFKFVSGTIGDQYTQLLIGCLVVTIGTAAFWFKKRNQRWYGFVEILVGSGQSRCLPQAVRTIPAPAAK